VRGGFKLLWPGLQLVLNIFEYLQDGQEGALCSGSAAVVKCLRRAGNRESLINPLSFFLTTSVTKSTYVFALGKDATAPYM
jgi:hypothetical protein